MCFERIAEGAINGTCHACGVIVESSHGNTSRGSDVEADDIEIADDISSFEADGEFQLD
jgi:hypothetical protein